MPYTTVAALSETPGRPGCTPPTPPTRTEPSPRSLSTAPRLELYGTGIAEHGALRHVRSLRILWLNAILKFVR